MHLKYYNRWGLFVKNPFWRGYLRKYYENGYQKLSYILDVDKPFERPNFTALLSGTHGETTAIEFAKFIYSKNDSAKLIILDINGISINKCKESLSKIYPNKNILFLNENILENSIESGSVDYIETDGFLQFFDPNTTLPKVIGEWSRILKPSGFITTRDMVTSNLFERIIVKFMEWGGKYYLGVKIHHQTQSKLEKLYFDNGFFTTVRDTWFPAFKQFTTVRFPKL